MSSITYLRPSDEHANKHDDEKRMEADMIRALNTDVELVAREARERGRIEGIIGAACFVVLPLILVDILTLV